MGWCGGKAGIMKVSDVAKVQVDWMEGFGNWPRLILVLKRDAEVAPRESFRWKEHDGLFYAEHEGEVRFVYHDRNDHQGFGGSEFKLQMDDSWDASTFRPCHRTERAWMSDRHREHNCTLDGRTVTICGPWHCGSSELTPVLGPVVEITVIEGKDRTCFKNLKALKRERAYAKAGKRFAYEGSPTSCTLKLSLLQEIIDRHAPHLEMYQGDLCYFPMLKGGQPKCPRKDVSVRESKLSDEQRMVGL